MGSGIISHPKWHQWQKPKHREADENVEHMTRIFERRAGLEKNKKRKALNNDEKDRKQAFFRWQDGREDVE